MSTNSYSVIIRAGIIRVGIIRVEIIRAGFYTPRLPLRMLAAFFIILPTTEAAVRIGFITFGAFATSFRRLSKKARVFCISGVSSSKKASNVAP